MWLLLFALATSNPTWIGLAEDPSATVSGAKGSLVVDDAAKWHYLTRFRRGALTCQCTQFCWQEKGTTQEIRYANCKCGHGKEPFDGWMLTDKTALAWRACMEAKGRL